LVTFKKQIGEKTLPFQLQIKFPGSGFLDYGEFSEHGEAYDAMLKHFKFLQQSIPQLKPMHEVNLQMVHSGVYQVLITNLRKSFNATGLFLVFRIIEHPDEKLSGEDLQRLGINPEAKRYKLGGRAYSKGPTMPVGNPDDIDWSE
jgi:hypothetical protein